MIDQETIDRNRAEWSDRDVADALWDTMEELGFADSRGGSAYRYNLLGQADLGGDPDAEGPNSQVTRWAVVGRKRLKGF